MFLFVISIASVLRRYRTSGKKGTKNSSSICRGRLSTNWTYIMLTNLRTTLSTGLTGRSFKLEYLNINIIKRFSAHSVTWKLNHSTNYSFIVLSNHLSINQINRSIKKSIWLFSQPTNKLRNHSIVQRRDSVIGKSKRSKIRAKL